MWIVACWRGQSRPDSRIDRRLRFMIAMVRLINAVGLIERIELFVVGLQIRVTKTQTSTNIWKSRFAYRIDIMIIGFY